MKSRVKKVKLSTWSNQELSPNILNWAAVGSGKTWWVDEEWSGYSCFTKNHFAGKMPRVLVCTCVAAKKTPACSYPLGKMRGWSKEISVDTCHAVLAGGTYLLLFVKIEYTIPSAFVQGISSNLSAHCSFIHVTEPHCSLEDGSGDAAVKKALVCLF